MGRSSCRISTTTASRCFTNSTDAQRAGRGAAGARRTACGGVRGQGEIGRTEMRARTWGARWGVLVTGALLSGVLVAATRPVAAAPGDLDLSFGTGGKVLTDFGGAAAHAVALQPDGQIVVAGV